MGAGRFEVRGLFWRSGFENEYTLNPAPSTGCQSLIIPYIRKGTLTLRLKIAQRPYVVWSLGPKALKYESLEP